VRQVLPEYAKSKAFAILSRSDLMFFAKHSELWTRSRQVRRGGIRHRKTIAKDKLPFDDSVLQHYWRS